MRRLGLLVVCCVFTIDVYCMDDQEKQDRVFIQQHFAGQAKSLASIERFNTGCTSSCPYKVAFINNDEKPVVIRFLRGNNETDDDRIAELSVMQAASDAHVGPRIIEAHAYETTPFVVMEYIQGIPLIEVPWTQRETSIKLALFLKKLHAQPVDVKVNPKRSWFNRLRENISILEKKWQEAQHIGMFDEMKNLSSCLEPIHAVLQTQRTHAIHGDLHTGNILYDGNFKAVDFDHTSMHNNQLYDVAYILNTLIPKSDRADFLQTYFGKTSAGDLAKLNLMRIVQGCLVGSILATCNKTMSEEIADKYKEFVQQKKIGQIIRHLSHQGLQRSRAWFVPFAAGLFYKGLKNVQNGQWHMLIELLTK